MGKCRMGFERAAAFAVLALALGDPGASRAQQTSKEALPGRVASEGTDLVPAAFGIWTDRTGNSWSVESAGNIGRIGSALVNSGLALLVNEEKFECLRPLMTRDGKELVLPGQPLPSLPGLEWQRRVRLLDAPGGLRFAELFHNGSTDPMRVSVGLATNFSGNYKTFLTDRGRSEPLLFEEGETSILVLPGSAQSSRAFLFTLTDGRSEVKPSISAQNRYGLTFRYDLVIDPGESAILVHTVAQVVIPRSYDRRSLLELTAPHALDRVRDSFPEDWTGLVRNSGTPPEESVRIAWESGLVAEDEGLAGVAPGTVVARVDTLLSGEQTRLSGKAEGGPVEISGPYGEAEFRFDRIAAIFGEKAGFRPSSRLYLKDGQVLSGRIEAPGLAFLPTGGSRLALDPVSMDRLLLATERVRDWPAGVAAVLETRSGDRLHLKNGSSFSLTLASPWGLLPVSLDQLSWLRPAPGGEPGFLVDFADGSRLRGFFAEATLEFSHDEIGNYSLNTNELRYIFTPFSMSLELAPRVDPAGTLVKLTGDSRLVGPITNTAIEVISEGGPVELATSEIRRLVRISGGFSGASEVPGTLPLFRLERWDDGVVTGPLGQETLAVAVGGRTWQIPVGDILAVEMASPALDAETLTRIEGLIRNLASDDWATRERATRELGAFGYLAHSILRRELRKVNDPEVGRRLERVLSGLN